MVGARFQALPGDLGMHRVERRVLQRGDFLLHPFGAPGLLQFCLQNFIDDPQMGHVGRGRIRAAFWLSGLRLQSVKREDLSMSTCAILRPERFVRRRVAEAADHGCDLAVEQRIGNHAALVMKDFDVLPRGVQDLHDAGRFEQLVEGRQVDAVGEGIDDRLDPRRRHLDQAQLGPIGLVAHELGIEREIGRARKFADEGLQIRCVFYDPHRTVIPDSRPKRALFGCQADNTARNACCVEIVRARRRPGIPEWCVGRPVLDPRPASSSGTRQAFRRPALRSPRAR